MAKVKINWKKFWVRGIGVALLLPVVTAILSGLAPNMLGFSIPVLGVSVGDSVSAGVSVLGAETLGRLFKLIK